MSAGATTGATTGAATGATTGAEALCLSCGLCCDGSLFWAVELEPADTVPDGIEAGGRLPQPCAFHTAGVCGIYATRPSQCRAFVCGVLQAVLDGTRDRAWAEIRIEAMRHLLAGLDDALPGEGALYSRAAAYLEDADALPIDDRIRARIAVYREMIGDFRPLSDAPEPTSKPG